MKLKNILSLLLITLSVVSCGYLDFDETNNLKTKEDIYSYFDRTKQMLTTVYGYMPQDFGTVAGAMRDCGSDDALFANTGGKVQAFNNGTWSSIKTVDSSWNSLYSGIRAANEFIFSVAEVDLSRYEYTGGYKNWMKQMAFFPYEARVLRAFYFFELARRYGDIAMPLKQLTVDEANNLEKTPFSNVIHFIVSESTEAAAILPVTYVGQPNSEVGRITKGFALALKSKALLYAASRLHNPSMDQTKWKASAKAALELINLANTGIYQLDPGDKANNLSSKEVILFRMNGANSDFEKNNFPLRFVEGSRSLAGNYPTQNLVDAFETQNGYQVALTVNGWISEDPDFNLQQPYLNRDPRFYKTVLANGMSFKGSRIELFKEGADDVSISQGGTPTGYFLRKYVNETTNFTPNAIVKNKHHWVIYRYAETLLTYAESMIEAFDDPNYKDEVYILSALDALNAIRNNASMPAITEINKQAFIETLRHEWRVEFAFEDHRFWDVRRWGIAENTQKEIYGVLIEKLEDKELLFARKSCETRKWANRMSLYPIPQEELFTNKKLNPQNADTIAIQVKSSNVWEVYNKKKEWATVTPDSGNAGELFDVAIIYHDNNNLDDRIDTVIVKSDYWIGKVIQVIQRGNAFLNLENDEDFLLPRKQGDYTFQVKSNQDWSAKITEGDSWLSISDGIKGTNDGHISIMCTENQGAMRYGKVIVYDRHEVECAEVTCTQDGIQVDPINDGSIITVQRAYYNDSEIKIDVIANTDWFVEKENTDQDWYSFEKTQYDGNDQLIIHLDKNEGMSLRQATFTLSSKLIEGLDPVSHVMTIKQANNPLLLTKRIEFDDAEKSNWTLDSGSVGFEGGDMICKAGRMSYEGALPGYYRFHIKSMSTDGYAVLFFIYPGAELRFHLDAKAKRTAMSTSPWTALNGKQISFDPTIENSIGLNVLDNGDGLTKIEWMINGELIREMVKYGNFAVDFSNVSSSLVYLGAKKGTVVYDWYEFTPLINWE